MVYQSRPVNPRMHYEVLTVTPSGCLKCASQSMRIEVYFITPHYAHKVSNNLPLKSKYFLHRGNKNYSNKYCPSFTTIISESAVFLQLFI